MMLPVVYSTRWLIGSLFAAYQPNDTRIFVSGEYLQFLIIEILIFYYLIQVITYTQKKVRPIQKGHKG